jgi:hypothetical protein
MPDKREELERNFAAFQECLPELLQSHAGKFAVIRNKKIVDFFDTLADAAKFAARSYPDDMFSIQEVSERRIQLGFFSLAIGNAAV